MYSPSSSPSLHPITNFPFNNKILKATYKYEMFQHIPIFRQYFQSFTRYNQKKIHFTYFLRVQYRHPYPWSIISSTSLRLTRLWHSWHFEIIHRLSFHCFSFLKQIFWYRRVVSWRVVVDCDIILWQRILLWR